MKRLLPVIICAFFLAFSFNCFAYQNIITDDADLFTDYEETEILSAIEDYSSEKDFSLAVVTVSYTSGLSSEEYADDYYNYLIDNEGFQENGLLFLIDTDNRNVWISTSGECILSYSNSEINSIIDTGYNSLLNGDYAQCVLEMTEAAKDTYTVIDNNDFYITDDSMYGDSFFSGSTVEINGQKYYIDENGEWFPVENSEDYYYNGFENDNDSDEYNSFDLSDVFIYIVIGLAVGGISVLAVKSRYKNQGKGDEFDSDDVVLNITASNDTVISKNVITTRIPKNNNKHHGGPRGGGFSSGGSSVHRSGGGRPHGGGGRRF